MRYSQTSGGSLSLSDSYIERFIHRLSEQFQSRIWPEGNSALAISPCSLARLSPDAASYAPVTVLIDQRTDGVHHRKCFRERDLDGLMAHYSADAVFFSPEGALRGPEAIRGEFKKLFSEFSKRFIPNRFPAH